MPIPKGLRLAAAAGAADEPVFWKINGVAVVIANEGIKITVTVEISKLRAGNGAYIRDPKGLGLYAKAR